MGSSRIQTHDFSIMSLSFHNHQTQADVTAWLQNRPYTRLLGYVWKCNHFCQFLVLSFFCLFKVSAFFVVATFTLFYSFPNSNLCKGKSLLFRSFVRLIERKKMLERPTFTFQPDKVVHCPQCDQMVTIQSLAIYNNVNLPSSSSIKMQKFGAQVCPILNKRFKNKPKEF